MADVHQFKPKRDDHVDGGSGNGNDGDMETEKRLIALETVVPTLATKADVAELRLATRADMADLRADLHRMDASIKTWMIATIIGLFFGFAGLFFTMNNALKPPAAQAAPPAPIIINVPASPAPALPASPSQK